MERLDRRGGRQVLNQVYADMNVQAFDHGVAVGGMGRFGYTLFTGIPDVGDPDFGRTPAAFGIAGAVFFAGFVMLAVA